MLRVTVESLPLGYGPPEAMDVVEIANDGTGRGNVGNYKVRRKSDGRTVLMRGHDRSKGWIALVWRALAYLERADDPGRA